MLKSIKSKSLALLTALSILSSSTALAATITITDAGEHAITATSGSQTYTNPIIIKTGDMSGRNDDYDWKGTNAAVLASGGAILTITGGNINSSASYGNAVFSYGGNNSNTNNNQGDNTTINISGTNIVTTKNNSGGIMTTGGGIMNASDLTITTSGGSSAAIRSDSGGGIVTVNGGQYTTNGQGSPAIYSTAQITVADADLTSSVAQGVVIEGGNSVTLTKSNIKASHTTRNGQDSTYQAVLIYKSMSNDAAGGQSSFSMTDGSITNSQGDIFCITNTTCVINLENVTITNNDSDGNFLRAEGQKWGNSGSNGGNVTLTASGQTIEGNIIVANDSSLTMTLKNQSSYKGAINSSSLDSVTTTATAGDVKIIVEKGSKLILTGNSYVSSLETAYTNDIEYGDYFINAGGSVFNKESPKAGTEGVNSDGSSSTNTDDSTTNDDGTQAAVAGGSGGGCNTGLASLALLTCAALGLKRK